MDIRLLGATRTDMGDRSASTYEANEATTPPDREGTTMARTAGQSEEGAW